MKSFRFTLVFATFALVACGSNNDRNPSTVTTGTATAQPATQISSEPTPRPPSATVNNANSNTSATTGSTSDANSTAQTMPAPSPTPPAIDPFIGSYPQVTLPLTTDDCAGSCGATIDAPAVTITHDAQGYHAGQLDATLHSEGYVSWSFETTGHIDTCQATQIHDGFSLGHTATGQLFRLYLFESDSQSCGGGHDYTCTCTYASTL